MSPDDTSCIVHRCRGRGGYRFPLDNGLKAEWLKAIKWAIPLEPKKTAVVCPSHFAQNDFEISIVDGNQTRKDLKSNAVPSIFPWNCDLWGIQESSEDLSEDEDSLQESSDSEDDTVETSGAEEDCSSAERKHTEPCASPETHNSQHGTTPCEATNIAKVGLASEESTSSSTSDDQASRASESGSASHQGDEGISPNDATNCCMDAVPQIPLWSNALPSSENQTSRGTFMETEDIVSSGLSAMIANQDTPASSEKSSQGDARPKKKHRGKKTVLEKPLAPSTKEKTRRHVTKFTIGQKAKLEQLFEENQYPDITQREEICRTLGIERNYIIKIWFQNRRAQLRREARKMNDAKNAEGESQTTAKPASVDGGGNVNNALPGSNNLSHSDVEIQQRLQKLWMYYGSQGCDIPQGQLLEEIAVECGLTPYTTKKWFEYAKRRFSNNKLKKSVATKYLLKKFIHNCYPTSRDLQDMSYSTGMEPDEIHNWFRTELYWQTMYFDTEEGNKASQEDNSDHVLIVLPEEGNKASQEDDSDHEPQHAKRRKGETLQAHSSDSEESSMSGPASQGSCQNNQQSENGNDTDNEPASHVEDALNVNLTEENESEVTQPQPSAPRWSDSDSSDNISLPSIDSGPNQRVVIQHWVDKLLKKRRYGHTEPISEDDDNNEISVIDLTDGTETAAVASEKSKQEDDDHSSDCEIIEPELPMIEIDSDDDQPPEPQTTSSTGKGRPPAKRSGARKKDWVPRQRFAIPQPSDTSNEDILSIYLPDSDSSEADRLTGLLKRLGPLKAGSIIKTAGNTVYRVVTAKYSPTSSNPTRMVIAKTNNGKRAGKNDGGTSRKTSVHPPIPGRVVLAREPKSVGVRDLASRPRNVNKVVPKKVSQTKRPKTDSSEGQISQPQNRVIGRVEANNKSINMKESTNLVAQPMLLLKPNWVSQPETTSQSADQGQFAGNGGTVEQPRMEIIEKLVTSVSGLFQAGATHEEEGLVTGVTPAEFVSGTTTVGEPMETLDTHKNAVASAEHAKPVISCGRTAEQPSIVRGTLNNSAPGQPDKPVIKIVKVPGRDNRVIIRGVINSQNGQKVAIIHPSIRQNEQPATTPQSLGIQQKKRGYVSVRLNEQPATTSQSIGIQQKVQGHVSVRLNEQSSTKPQSIGIQQKVQGHVSVRLNEQPATKPQSIGIQQKKRGHVSVRLNEQPATKPQSIGIQQKKRGYVSVRLNEQPATTPQSIGIQQKVQGHVSVRLNEQSLPQSSGIQQNLQSHPSVQQNEPPGTMLQAWRTLSTQTCVEQNLQTNELASKAILIGQTQPSVGFVPLSPVQVNGEGFSFFVNLVPEEDNLFPEIVDVVTLKVDGGLDAHCQYLESKLQKVEYAERPLFIYKNVFLPELQHGLIYWGHCPGARRLFKLQKSIIGAIMGVEAPTPKNFSTLKLHTLPSMYVLQCLIHVHKNRDRIHQLIQESKMRQSKNMTKLPVPLHESNGYRLYKCLPPEMSAMRTDVFIAVLRVFLNKNPLFSIGAYFEAIKSLGSNSTQTATPEMNKESDNVL